jgi:hypothetical protein
VRPEHDPERQIVFFLPPNPVLSSRSDDEREAYKGFSGCGVWRVPDDEGQGLGGQAQLIGIFTRQHAEKEYLVATSLKCVLDRLATSYPDLKEAVSKLPPLEP